MLNFPISKAFCKLRANAIIKILKDGEKNKKFILVFRLFLTIVQAINKAPIVDVPKQVSDKFNAIMTYAMRIYMIGAVEYSEKLVKDAIVELDINKYIVLNRIINMNDEEHIGTLQIIPNDVRRMIAQKL